ncbi:MAG TPA: signal recognition particle receptor subunit alpha [Candidatus Polarisedimenticolia bacterium]|nr:signal recognition particle receptor subunit alpha [Candidatus Polarisedimenticolia bacterium]
MFEALTERLQKAFRTLRGHGHLTEAELSDGLREIRLALLEADVHLQVVKELIERVREKAAAEEILKSLTPGQQVVKALRDEMVAILAQGHEARLRQVPVPPTVVLMVGLQGSGKTTTTAKLARLLKSQGRSPLLVDTAGRLHIDEELMVELSGLKDSLRPAEILYVADAMTGQDAVRSAAAFHARLGLTGVVLSKADGDARGGAALSLRHVTGVPIKFVGTGEHLDDLEAFHPDRLVSRVLGMGDVLTLIEKAEAVASREDAETMGRRLRRNELTLEDLATELEKVSKIGSLRQILGMLPGAAALKDMPVDEGSLVRTRAIISSMTRRERAQPEVINGRRRLRIAKGSGTEVADVNRLLKQFKQMKKMMKTMGRGGSGLGARSLFGVGRR